MSFMCKIEVGPKREECKKGGWCTGCQKFFEVGPRREKCEKGGGCEKGGCEAVPHLGAKKIFRALRARTHLKKILNTPLYLANTKRVRETRMYCILPGQYKEGEGDEDVLYITWPIQRG